MRSSSPRTVPTSTSSIDERPVAGSRHKRHHVGGRPRAISPLMRSASVDTIKFESLGGVHSESNAKDLKWVPSVRSNDPMGKSEDPLKPRHNRRHALSKQNHTSRSHNGSTMNLSARSLSPKQRSSRSIRDALFSESSHVFINVDRIERGLCALNQDEELDEIAQRHANDMAETQILRYPPRDDDFCPGHKLGVNVSRGQGASIRDMYTRMTENPLDRANVLDPEFTRMGFGIVKSKVDGMIYLCEVFGN